MSPDVIHLLPDSVANQIAAGEVIQRPASVVKELVENSVDAGATKIDIIIKDAGRTLIQVVDNGCGMSVMDARMAFERHATSKIQQASDLFSLCTMGFRGEALPSIAAVSEIEMRSMRQDDVAGTRINISASKVESQQPDVCATGTNIMVKRLFFNLPARRKFLKKDAIELGHITREFERLALVNTEIEFSLTHNDILIHRLPAAPLKKRICDLFGKILDHQLIPISSETSLVTIDGFVGLPANARRRGALQYFFVNGRNMRHPYFHKAVMNCYENLIAADTQPCYFINFKVDPETIDVNIHPQKHEIKFENEQPIWQILSATIKESLGRFNATSAIDFDMIDAPDIPPYVPKGQQIADNEPDFHFDPFKWERQSQQSSTPRPEKNNRGVSQDWEKLYESFTAKSATIQKQDVESQPADVDDIAVSKPLITPETETPTMFQLKGRYIVMPSKSGLMIIDQHRAHVRILFQKYHDMTQQGNIPSQRLIFPESVTMDASQSIVTDSITPLLSTMGFDISNLGGNLWSINAVPAFLDNANPGDALINIVESVSDADEDIEQSQWQKITLSMARSAAVKYGVSLTQVEMDQIVSELFRLTTPNYTPDGKLVVRLLNIEDINKMF